MEERAGGLPWVGPELFILSIVLVSSRMLETCPRQSGAGLSLGTLGSECTCSLEPSYSQYCVFWDKNTVSYAGTIQLQSL